MDAASDSPATQNPGAYVDRLLERMVARQASDLHLTVPSPTVFRIEGRLVPQTDLPPVAPADVQAVLDAIATESQRAAFARDLELDFAYSLPGRARFRVNAMRQRGSVSLAFRFVPFRIPGIDELGLPPICKEFILAPRGLILISGAAGNGKSTTLAAMLDHLNSVAARNVVTIEDPIEFLFRNDRCLIRQRELGPDVRSFAGALVHALRHDPDVIVVGELRDLPTVATALTAAETGHLVVGTLHTVDAAQSIDRVIDLFPADQQRQVRLQLSQVLVGVLAQVLLPRVGGGRIAAFEIMPATPGIRKIIRDGNLLDVLPNLEMGSQEGKQSLDQDLARLVKAGLVAREDALQKSSRPARLTELIGPIR